MNNALLIFGSIEQSRRLGECYENEIATFHKILYHALWFHVKKKNVGYIALQNQLETFRMPREY